MITRVYSVIPCISLGLSHYSYGFCTWRRHGNLAELKASELGQLKCDLLGLGRTCGCLGYIHIYIYTTPFATSSACSARFVWENKKNKTTLEKQKKPLSKSLGNRGGQPRVSKYCFLFCFSIFFGLLEFFFGFLLGAFFKVSFFFPVLWGDFSMFFWFYPRGLLQRVIFFCFFVVFFRFF